MDKANIIISIIVVLCIAAAVAAYGITNSDSPIFSDLSSMASSNDAGNGVGNISSLDNGTGSSVATTSSSSGSSGSSSSGSSGGSSSGSGSGSSSGSGSGGSGTSTHLSYSQAQSIANGAISEAGCYAGNGRYSNGYWIFTVYDANGNAVDGIGVNDATGMTERM